MSKQTAELWDRAKERERSPSEIEAELATLNRELDWDRERLKPIDVDGDERAHADD